MGNNLAAIAPNQILPVEQYLQDHVFEIQSLGSTRFMKVVRAKTASNASVVAKVFVIHDPKLQTYVDSYKEANKLLTGKLLGKKNIANGKACLGLTGDCCLPFDYIVQDCNSSGRFLTRAYLASNLYDRLHTRPFLTTIERKFIAFQIIMTMARAHSEVVRHGDLKLENILLTSWNWVQVSDFAFFKPVFLPDKNPSGFNFYFDSSRKRTCNIAPERFIAQEPSVESIDIVTTKPEFDESGNHKELKPTMDIFSLGCVIGQLFAENHLFDLSQLLSYKFGSGYTPEPVINQIQDQYIRNLVWDMIKVNPSERKTADEYLSEFRGTAFPEYFYTFLYNFMRSFTVARSSDRNIILLFDHYPSICQQVTKLTNSSSGGDNSQNKTEDLHEVTLIIFSLVLSNLRSLRVEHSKLCALKLIETMCLNLDSDSILTRAVPSIVYFLKDSSSKVVATSISCLTNSLKNVTRVDVNQRKVFVEYIFPDLHKEVFTKPSKMTPQQLQSFCVDSVHHEFIKCFPHLVEMSHKFLDLSLGAFSKEENKDAANITNNAMLFSYDEELRILRKSVEGFYLAIFSKDSPMKAQLFIESDVIKLCTFHGHQPDEDPLDLYLPTFNKSEFFVYWPLKLSYFRNIVNICVYYGVRATRHHILTFIEQGIHNFEEFVIVETLNTVRLVFKLNLFNGNEQKLCLFEKILPLLLHPNPWVRLNTARAISEACHSVGPTTARGCIHPKVNEYCKNFGNNCKALLLFSPPAVSPVQHIEHSKTSSTEGLEKIYQKWNMFKTKWGLNSIDNPTVLLSNIEPIRRFSYDKLCSYSNSLKEVLDYCENLVLMKNIEDQSYPAAGNFSTQDFKEFPPSFTDADKLLVQALYFEDRDSGKGYDARPDLHKTKLLKEHVDTRRNNIEKSAKSNSNYSFLTNQSASEVALPDTTPVILIKSNSDPDSQNPKSKNQEDLKKFCYTIRINTSPTSVDNFTAPLAYLSEEKSQNNLNWEKLKLFPKDTLLMPDNCSVENFSSNIMGTAFYTDTPCLGFLRVLARDWKKNNRKRIDYNLRQRDRACTVTIPPWRPVGNYVASLHDHSSAVNQLAVAPNNSLFASCSNDGTCRIWNPSKWEMNTQDPLHHSAVVNIKRPIKSLAFLSNEAIVTSCPDSLQIIDTERTGDAPTQRSSGWTCGLVRSVGNDEGSVIAMTSYENVITSSTNRNCVFGWDLRSKGGLNNAYYFQTKPYEGLITSMVVAENGLCVVLGSSLGRFSVWDLRFLMPVKTFAPQVSCANGGKFKVPAVHCLKRHAFDREAVVASMRGNFEISVWKLESGSRSKIFWSSPSPPLEYQAGEGSVSNNYAMGFYITGTCDSDLQIISGGSDKRVRLWDVGNVNRSYVISNSIQPRGVEQTFHYNFERVAISRDSNFNHPTRTRRTLSSNKYDSSNSNNSSSNDKEYVDVIKETMSQTEKQVIFRKGPELPAFSHRDLVTDTNVVVGQSNTRFLISSDMSGVIKVWK